MFRNDPDYIARQEQHKAVYRHIMVHGERQKDEFVATLTRYVHGRVVAEPATALAVVEPVTDEPVVGRVDQWNQRVKLVNNPSPLRLIDHNNLWLKVRPLERLLEERYDEDQQAIAAVSTIREFYIYHDPMCYGGMVCWTVINNQAVGYGRLKPSDYQILHPGEILAVVTEESPDDIDDHITEHWDNEYFKVFSDRAALEDNMRSIRPDDPILITSTNDDGDEVQNVEIHTFESILERHEKGEAGIV